MVVVVEEEAPARAICPLVGWDPHRAPRAAASPCDVRARESNAGMHFDPTLVALFLEILPIILDISEKWESKVTMVLTQTSIVPDLTE